MINQNPILWGWQRLKLTVGTIGSASPDQYWAGADRSHETMVIRKIGTADLRDALRQGMDDFAANRTDVIFLCMLYPLLGLLFSRVASGYGVVPLLFPVASGFALIGPFAAIGLNEMSRRREQGQRVSWIDAFGVLRSPAIGAILLMGLLLMAIYLVWLVAAEVVYNVTLGPEPPVSIGAFVQDVFTTPNGWAMIVLGIAIGFLFAAVVLVISAVSFPLLLDRNVGVNTAILASIKVARANPRTVAIWGLIVAVALVVGSIPLFLGLALVMPILGHATWHLYRKAIGPG
jgi:uncharacterized membrane protein